MDRDPERLRLKLHAALKDLLKSPNIYFQPPESVDLKYPCAIYKRSSGKSKYADNHPYTFRQAYQITIIDSDPDSDWITKMAYAFPTVKFDTHFTKDNLNHDVFTLFI